jgi:hypothetical protein
VLPGGCVKHLHVPYHAEKILRSAEEKRSANTNQYCQSSLCVSKCHLQAQYLVTQQSLPCGQSLLSALPTQGQVVHHTGDRGAYLVSQVMRGVCLVGRMVSTFNCHGSSCSSERKLFHRSTRAFLQSGTAEAFTKHKVQISLLKVLVPVKHQPFGTPPVPRLRESHMLLLSPSASPPYFFAPQHIAHGLTIFVCSSVPGGQDTSCLGNPVLPVLRRGLT